MEAQVPHEFKLRWVTYTKQHSRAWRAKHPDWRQDTIESSMLKMQTVVKPHHFDLWIAARLRVAQLKPELSAHRLWDQTSSLFDAQLFAALTFKQFGWFNREGATS
eukprot:scaffold66587_cov28-Tisochrysis_lutea.AAC.1